MKFMTKTASVIILIISIALSACTKKSDSVGTLGKALLRVAYLPTANYFTILTRESFLEDEMKKTNALVEFVGPSAPVDAINIVTLGNADVTSTGTGYFINLIEQGGPWVAFALEKYSGNSQGIVAASSGINTLHDLYGKKIGIAQRGATADYIVNTAFAFKGLDVSRIEKIELAQADFMAAFTAGKIDALASFDQNLANALSLRGAKKLIDGTEYDSLNWTIHIARKQFAAEHPELLKAAYRALREAAAKTRANPQIITDTYRQFGAGEEQLAIIAAFDVPQILPMNTLAVADLNKQARQYQQYGFIKTAPADFSAYVLDFSDEGN